jgi:uncharacterized protein (TIGR00106 family)
MSTILEGQMSDIQEAVKAMHEVPFHMGAMRVSTTLRIDERRDKKITMESKLAAVRGKL